MPDRFIATRIRDLPLFEKLTDAQVDQMSDAFQAIRFEPGMIVFRQGQASQGLMLIASGRGVFTRFTPQGSEESIGQIGAGEYINESALFNEQYETATLRAVESMIVLLLSRGRFAQFLSGKPEIRTNLRVPPGWGGSPPVSASTPPPMPAPPQQAVYTPPVQPSAPARRAELTPSLQQPVFRQPAAAIPPAQPAPQPMTESALRTSPARLFKGQRDDETVLHVFKRHWWAVARSAWISVVIVMVAVVVAAGLSPASGLLALAVIGAGLVLGAIVIGYLYVEWRDDMAVVTDQRLIRISNYVLRLENTFSDVPLDRVLEINVDIPAGDPFARVFNYGTVIIKTAGQGGKIEVDMIPQPMRLQNAIFTQRDRYRESSVARQRAQVQADIQQALGYAPNTPHNVQSGAGGIMDPELRTTRGFFLARTRFINDKGEMVYRKHFTVWFGHIVIPLLLTLAGIGVMIVSFAVPESILRGGIGLSLGGFIFVLGTVWLYIADWDWRNDLFIVGEQTVTIIHKRPFWLQNQIDQIRMSQIDNVVSDVSGLLDTLLNRGMVKLYLIGADTGKVLGPVYDPQELGSELSRRQQVIKAQRERDEAAKNRTAITDYLAQYHQVVTQGQTPGQFPTNAPYPPTGQTAPPSAPPAPPPIQPRDGIRPPNIPRARRDSELE